MAASRLYWFLLAVAVAIATWRVASGQVDPTRLGQDREFVFEFDVELRDSVGPFELEVFIPRAGDGLRLQEERIGADDVEIRVAESEAGRLLTLRGDRAALPARVPYAVRLSTKPVRFSLPRSLRWKDVSIPAALDSSQLIPAGHEEIQAALRELFSDAFVDSAATPGPATAWRQELERANIGPIEAIDRIHLRCLNGLRAANYSGRTDAITALRLGEASCGGKSRLMAAMCRTLGAETRIVGGLILGGSHRKRTSHAWVEVKLGDQWVPFDPLNSYRAERPAHYVQLYLGDLPLITHSRGLAFDYGFRAPMERVPSVWTLDTRTAPQRRELPLLRREQFSLILLAPFALLVVVFMRQVVGVNSIGVFLPVLLGFCVTQVGWVLSASLLALTLLLGVAVRLVLTRMNMLHVPRAALLISFLVLLFLMVAIALEQFGIDSARGVLVLPLAALAMFVERITVIALDQGSRASMRLLGQTLLLSVLSAFVLLQPLFKVLTVTFPEILLVVLAEIIVIGQYRGLRLSERRRFRALLSDGVS